MVWITLERWTFSITTYMDSGNVPEVLVFFSKFQIFVAKESQSVKNKTRPREDMMDKNRPKKSFFLRGLPSRVACARVAREVILAPFTLPIRCQALLGK